MQLDNIRGVLNSFKSHSLTDLNLATLMSRVDTKYVFHISQLSDLLNAIKNDYSVLEINNRRISQYSSIYFDTDNLLFYSMHHQGRANRHKVRIRHYVDSGEKYLEIKFKNNKGRTIKKRCAIDLNEQIDSEHCRSFMESLGVPQYSELMPSQESTYNRIALACEARGERVTIDVNLKNRLLLDGEGRAYRQPDIVIAEVKQAKASRNTPITEAIRHLGIRKSRYSKYCIGMVLTTPDKSEVKKNRFKKIVRKVSSITECAVA